jgi:hypothetical protein
MPGVSVSHDVNSKPNRVAEACSERVLSRMHQTGVIRTRYKRFYRERRELSTFGLKQRSAICNRGQLSFSRRRMPFTCLRRACSTVEDSFSAVHHLYGSNFCPINRGHVSVMDACKRFQTVLLLCTLVLVLQPPQAFSQASSDQSRKNVQRTPEERNGQRDFDFEIGTWKTHLRRLLHPLTGSTTWVEYDGMTVVRSIWNGRANLVELVVDGPAGRIEALSLRLYNAKSRQWSLNFASSGSGSLGQAAIGEFKNGRGEFFNQETLNGRAILVRFVIFDVTPTSCRFEQSFSDDGGKTWEVNWIATDTRT